MSICKYIYRTDVWYMIHDTLYTHIHIYIYIYIYIYIFMYVYIYRTKYRGDDKDHTNIHVPI